MPSREEWIEVMSQRTARKVAEDVMDAIQAHFGGSLQYVPGVKMQQIMTDAAMRRGLAMRMFAAGHTNDEVATRCERSASWANRR